MESQTNQPRVFGRDSIGYGDAYKALTVQARVIHALMLREAQTRYGAYKLGFLWAYVESSLTIAVFVAIFFVAGRRGMPGHIDIVAFHVASMVPFFMFTRIMRGTSGALRTGRSLTRFPQVGDLDLMFARVLLDCTTTLVILVTLFTMVHLFWTDIRLQFPLNILGLLAALATLGMGMGVTISVIGHFFPATETFVEAALGRPLFVTSGLFFTAASLPKLVRDLFLWNPLLHANELMREAVFGQFVNKYASWSYLWSFALTMVFFGLLAQRALRKQLLEDQ